MPTNPENQQVYNQKGSSESRSGALWSMQKPWQNAVTIFLILAIIASVSMTVYLIKSGKGDSFTEFYILDLEGKAIDYPSNIKFGDSASVRLGIVNHEHSTKNYSFEISDNGTIINSFGPVTLAYKEKWENVVTFKPVMTGADQKIEFVLRKNQNLATDNSTPISLSLWVNVN
jgi:uncharacterized membrane protein